MSQPPTTCSVPKSIDLLGYAILSNHFHLILRTRPDVVATWDDREVASPSEPITKKKKTDDSSKIATERLAWSTKHHYLRVQPMWT